MYEIFNNLKSIYINYPKLTINLLSKNFIHKSVRKIYQNLLSIYIHKNINFEYWSLTQITVKMILF